MTCIDGVKRLMADGKFHALGQLSKKLGYGETTISSALRKLRQPKRGAYVVSLKRDHRARGFSYRLSSPGMFAIPVGKVRKCRCPSCGGRGFKYGRIVK